MRMIGVLEHYRRLFATLHTNIDNKLWRAMPGSRAPHKPLLLLAVIVLLERGSIKTNLIQLNPELARAFERFWALSIGQERTGNPVLPFFHLKADGFWHLVPMPGKEEALTSVRQISSMAELQALVQGAKLDQSLYELLVKEETRKELRKVLLDHYFAPAIRTKLRENDERDHFPIAPLASQVPQQLSSAFQQFQQDTLLQFGVRVRRKRAGQLRDLLANPESVSLETFNKEVWPLEAGTYLPGSNNRLSIFSPKPLSPEQMTEQLEKALESGELELHGNYVWGSGTAVYCPQLKDEIEKVAYIRQALTILNDAALSPLEKAKQLDSIYGFGRNIATGLVMLFHPTKFAIFNQQSERALKQLGYDVNTLEAFEESARRLSVALKAADFLELDYFLYLLNQGKYGIDAQPRFWWVNQGDTYMAERDGGYLWAPKEGKGGRVFTHHENVARMRSGDVVLHYSQGALRATSQVIEAPIEADRPGELPENLWGKEGFLVRVAYHDLPKPVPLESIDPSWRTATAGPFTQQGSVKQGYLYQLSEQFVRQLLPFEPTEPFPPSSKAKTPNTVSLLNQQCIDLLDLTVPGWQSVMLSKGNNDDAVGIMQALAVYRLHTLGDLCVLTPLTLLSLCVKNAGPPPEGIPFWTHVLYNSREFMKPLLSPLLAGLLSEAFKQETIRKEPPSQQPETGYSSLLIQPGETFDQVAYPDSITIIRWPFVGQRSVNFAIGEIKVTPLLAAHVRDALREHGCDLRNIPLAVLPLAPRTANLFSNPRYENYKNLEVLARQTPEQLLARRNLGPHAYEETLRALYNFLTSWLAQLPADTLVPPKHLHQFEQSANETLSFFEVPEASAKTYTQEFISSSKIYSSIFIRSTKVLEQISRPTAPTISLYTPFGKSRPVRFIKGEVKASPLLAPHLCNSLRDLGCDLRNILLSRLSLSPRSSFLLTQAHIETLEQLAQETPETLLSRRGFGVRHYEEVIHLFSEFLESWLASLPLDILVPKRSGAYGAPSNQNSENFKVQEHAMPRQGKNALFFPIDAVLSSFSWLPTAEKENTDSAFILSSEVAQNSLLSEKLSAVLAEAGCDLINLPLEQLFLNEETKQEPLTIRTYHALIRARIRRANEVTKQTPAGLLSIRNFGPMAYRTLVVSLRDYLSPWLLELGINPVTGEGAETYEDPMPKAPISESSSDDIIQPDATIRLSEAFANLRSSDLFSWLEYYEVDWRQIRVEEICPSLEVISCPADLCELTLDNLDQPGQMLKPDPPISQETADQIIANTWQMLIVRLVEHLLELKPSYEILPKPQQALGLATVESLLVETLNQYILAKRKSSGQRVSDLPREMIVMLSRAGILEGQPKTLGELAAEFHLTRERIRQLDRRVVETLQKGGISPFVESLTALVKWASYAEGGVTTVSRAGQRLSGWLPFGRLHPEATIRLLVKWSTGKLIKGDARLAASQSALALLDEIDGHVEQLLKSYPGGLSFPRFVDEIMLAGGEKLFEAGRDFISAALRISDEIEIQNDFCLPRSMGTFRMQLASILRNLGRPAHFNEIAERYNVFYPDEKPPSGHAVANTLLRFPEFFTRTGNGTYALAGVGYESALTVEDTLEHIFQESDQPLHVNEVVARSRERYQWTETVLQAGLRTNPKIVSLGHGFFGLADRTYPEIDASKRHQALSSTAPFTKERLVVATFTNKHQHVVIQLKLSLSTVKGFIPSTSKAVRDLFPIEGVFKAEALCPGEPTRMLTLRRNQNFVSGLQVWLKQIDAKPHNYLFVERLDSDPYTYHLAYAPPDKLAEAMQMVGLSPTDEAEGTLDYRVLWRIREPEKLRGLLTHVLEHSWTTQAAINTAMGFAQGRPEGPEYLELGLLGGLLAVGKIEGPSPREIVRSTPFGRAWIAQRHDTEKLAASLVLSLPPYRAHLRSDFQDQQTDDDNDGEQMPIALLNPKLLTHWDARFGLAASALRDRALRESNAVITTARLPGRALTMLLLLLAAQSNGLGIAFKEAEAEGLADAQDTAMRLRQLGIALRWNAFGHVALGEQVHLAVTSSTSVEARLSALGGAIGSALAESWRALQQNAWPLHPISAADLYTTLMGMHAPLLNSLLVPTPEGIDQAARYVDGRCVPCPFVSLAADWGLISTKHAPAPFAFLAHAIRLVNGQAVEPVAICLNRELLGQDWEVKRALAANAHLALLTLIASDVGGLAERGSLSERGYAFVGKPLVVALDNLLRGLGYSVWDEDYRQDATMQAILGQELVALAEQLGLLSGASGKFRRLSAIAQCQAACVADGDGGAPTRRDACAHSSTPSPCAPPPRSRANSRTVSL